MRHELEYLRDECARVRDEQRHTTSDEAFQAAALMCIVLDKAIQSIFAAQNEAYRNAKPGPVIQVSDTYDEGFAAGVRAAMALAKVKP